jgi:SNF2 family DNA or RNA helicase
VAEQLPEKCEQVVWVEMSEKQKEVYENFLMHQRAGLLKKVAAEGLSAHRMEILEAILRLRQICCHPVLVEKQLEADEAELSAKMDRLIEDIESVALEQRKVLVYSQFTQALRLIEQRVQDRGWKYVYLDGSTRDRESMVRQFQEDPETTLFLISLKAGGVGLNLTAADYVFLFDPWWNEAVEKQAIDRAHRVGRTQQVIARRYVVSNSIEEKMMRLKEHKSSLAASILDLDGRIEDLTLEDLLQLLT